MQKKIKPLEISEDRPTAARRRARQAVGTVQPSRAMTPKTLKPPKHKRAPDAEAG